MVGAVPILLSFLMSVPGPAGVRSADDAEQPEDDRPLYYGSEVVVISDRPARFEPFAPEPASIAGQTSAELAWTPHVAVGDYGTSAYAAVRGLSSEHVGLEYDGIPLNSLQNGLADIALFDVFDTEATMMRGPFARLAAGRPAQAAVSLRQRSGEATSVSVSHGSLEESARLSISRGGFAFRAGMLADEGYTEKSDAGGFGAEMSARTPLGHVALTYIDVDRGIPGPEGQEVFAGEQRDELFLARAGLGELEFTGFGGARPGLYFVRQNQEYTDSYSDPTHVTWSGGAIVELDLGDLLPGTAATVSYDRSRIDSRDSRNPDLGVHSRDSGSVVASHVRELGPVQVALEGAGTRTSDFDAAFSGAVGVSVPLGRGRTWVSYGTTWRPPTINELYWPSDAWSSGNPDLDPERVVTLEVGAEARAGVFTGVVSVYDSRAEDLISWASDPSDWLYKPRNVGEARLRGLELELAAEPWTCARFSYAGSFSRSEDGDAGRALAYRPEVTQWFSAEVTVESVTTGFRLRHVSEVFTDDTEGNELDGYSVMDVSSTLVLPVRGAALRFDVLNLGDTDYATRASYDYSGGEWLPYVMPGREWRLSLLLDWGGDGADPRE
jgi:hypothetical protein